MRAGGDGYSIFETAGKNAYDFGPDLADVTVEYLAAHNPYKPYTDGRIAQAAPAATAAPAAPAAPSAQAPAATAPAASAPAAATPASHVIAAGDTLWDLAKQFYGDGELWKKISEANGNPDPRRLMVGKELQVPAK